MTVGDDIASKLQQDPIANEGWIDNHMKGLVISVCLFILVSGCSSMGREPNPEQVPLVGDAAADKIVADLSGVLAQLFDPLDVTIQFSNPKTAYGRVVVASLRELSFGMQRVKQDQGARFLQYSESVSTGSSRENEYLYQISMGDVRVERKYALKGGNVYPLAPMVVRGSRKSASLDTNLFDTTSDDLDFINQIDYREVELAEITVPRISLVTDKLVEEIASSTLDLPNEFGVNATNKRTKNIYYTNESNFSSITRNYEEVFRDVVLFGDDSMRLGRTGKRQVREVLSVFEQETDFINLIGCSQGVTKREGGNEALALGRAKRVFDEFVSLGVPKTNLLDEGCWAPEASQARYPGRAVVVVVKRRRS